MGAKRLNRMAMRAATERSLIDATALIQGREFESIEEANAFLQKKEGGLPPAPADTLFCRRSRSRMMQWRLPGAAGWCWPGAHEISEDCADAWAIRPERREKA